MFLSRLCFYLIAVDMFYPLFCFFLLYLSSFPLFVSPLFLNQKISLLSCYPSAILFSLRLLCTFVYHPYRSSCFLIISSVLLTPSLSPLKQPRVYLPSIRKEFLYLIFLPCTWRFSCPNGIFRCEDDLLFKVSPRRIGIPYMDSIHQL